jgi:hypothetical protein
LKNLCWPLSFRALAIRILVKRISSSLWEKNVIYGQKNISGKL